MKILDGIKLAIGKFIFDIVLSIGFIFIILLIGLLAKK